MEKGVKRKEGAEVESSDICHDFDDTEVLDTSHESLEVNDEILKKTTSAAKLEGVNAFGDKMHLKKEKWKFKTRKKRKKTEDLNEGVIEALGSSNAAELDPTCLQMTSEKRVSRSGSREEESSVDNMELQAAKMKYMKLDMKKRQTPYGQSLFMQISGKPKKLDSGGNSENHSSSEDSKKRRPSWWEQTAECDVCGKEMLKSQLKKHAKTAHKSRKLYPCDECSFNAPNINELKVHLRKKHKLSMVTVMKMIKFIKDNRKHRRSMIEDEDDAAPRATNKRLLGLNSTIKDECHQTGSEAESRQTRKRINYREISIDNEEDEGMDCQDEAELTEAEMTEAEVTEAEVTEGEGTEAEMTESEMTEAEHVNDEFKDSGLESQPTSQDEKEDETPVEELLAAMRKLKEDEMPEKGSRHHSPAQVELLQAFFAKCNKPSKEQEAQIAVKLGMETKQIFYWFGKARRKEVERKEKALKREEMGLSVEVHDNEEGNRAARGKKTLGLLMAAPLAVPSSLSIVEYTEEDVVESPVLIDDLIQGDGPVCIAVDLNLQNNQCLLCPWSCSFRGNLFKHLRNHGFVPKCCTMSRKPSKLGRGIKGCRKTFTQETFNLHECDRAAPVHFRGQQSALVAPADKRPKKQQEGGWESSDDEEEQQKQQEELMKFISSHQSEGNGVCVGYEEHETLCHCTLCDFNTTQKGNLYAHIKRHCMQFDTKFCSFAREPSKLEINKRSGCRKVFLADSFDQHTCFVGVPGSLGSFPLKSSNGNSKKGEKKKKAGGFRGYEKNFGKPDGSPAKFYSDRYTRVFSQLGVAEPSERLGSSLMWQLDYLTSGQMTAVKDYVDDPGQRFYLVRKGFST